MIVLKLWTPFAPGMHPLFEPLKKNINGINGEPKTGKRL